MLSTLLTTIASVIVIFVQFQGVDCVSNDTDSPGLYFSQQPVPETIIVQGRVLHLSCDALGDDEAGDVNILWRKNGKVLSNSEIMRDGHILHSGGSLLFNQVVAEHHGLSDAGTYQCEATNRHGTVVSFESVLRIASLSHFSTSPDNTTGLEGEAIRLHCRVDGVPTPQITWEKNRQPLSLNNTRLTVLRGGVLQITHLQQEDAGKYRCKASNQARARHSYHAVLTVLPSTGSEKPARFVVGPQDQTVKVNETALFECLATGTPLPNIVWTREDGTPVPLGGRMQIVGRGNLQISEVERSDKGKYYCQIDEQPQKRVFATLSVTVAPEPADVSPALIRGKRNESIQLKCHFRGHPRPKMTWYWNGKLVKERPGVKFTKRSMRTLVLESVSSTDSGMYQCFAENSAGVDQHTMRLEVFDTATYLEPPIGLRLLSVEARTAWIAWNGTTQPADRDHQVIAYSVHYYHEGGQKLERVVEKVESGFYECELEFLYPYHNYTVYLEAYTSQALRRKSKSITFMTKEDVPVAAPDVTLTPLGPTAIKVSWTTLTPSNARGLVEKYRVYYKGGSASSYHVENVHGSMNSYVITDLMPDTEYLVRVLAGTKAGYPALGDLFWPWVSAETPPLLMDAAVPPDPPHLKLETLNSTAILAMWNTLAGDGIRAETFTLTWSMEGSNTKNGSDTLTASQTRGYQTHSIGGLEPENWYFVSLVAQNKHGNKGPVTRSMYVHGADALGNGRVWPSKVPPPSGLEAVPYNNTAILVKWQATGPSTAYTIRYISADRAGSDPFDADASYSYVISETTSVVVGGLEPFTEYEFTVSSSGHRGPFADAIRCRTKEGRPSAPQNVNWSISGPGEVELTWHPPKHPNGVIVAYVIMYRIAQPELMWAIKRENGTVTHALVSDLEEAAVYSFKMQAATSVGAGPETTELHVFTLPDEDAVDDEQAAVSPPQRPIMSEEREMGIIIGVCIGGGCIIICALLIIFRNRCFPPPRPPSSPRYASYPYNGHAPTEPSSRSTQPDYTMEGQEMDSLLPKQRAQGAHNGQANGKPQANGHALPGGVGNQDNSPNDHGGDLQVQYLPNGQLKTCLVPNGSGKTQGGGEIPPETSTDLQSESISSLDNIDYDSQSQTACSHGDNSLCQACSSKTPNGNVAGNRPGQTPDCGNSDSSFLKKRDDVGSAPTSNLPHMYPRSSPENVSPTPVHNDRLLNGQTVH